MSGFLTTQLGSPPAASLTVTSFLSNSLGEWMVLLLFLGQELLDSESCVDCKCNHPP